MRPSFQRREKIMEYLRVHSFATVSGLARELDCSEMTIRRDLDRLASQGKLERRHGGAMMTGRVKLEFALGEKALINNFI